MIGSSNDQSNTVKNTPLGSKEGIPEPHLLGTLSPTATHRNHESAALAEIVQLIGPDALPERERLTLEVARMIREDYLQQHAFHKEDTFCPLEKQLKMLTTIIAFEKLAGQALENGAGIDAISKLAIRDEISRMKYIPNASFSEEHAALDSRMQEQFKALGDA